MMHGSSDMARNHPQTDDASPTLFDLGRPGPASDDGGAASSDQLIGGRHPQILLGTSAFTANGWQGTFYPAGMKPPNYLRHYGTRFRTVEIDSTFYGTPQPARVEGWYEKTPRDFVFAAKVPQVITHEKILVDCEAEFSEFITTMELLKEKLGPLLLQFGSFSKYVFRNGQEFLQRLVPFLRRLPSDHRFVVEIRNMHWLDEVFLDALREHRVALALTDSSWMPRPWEMVLSKGTPEKRTSKSGAPGGSNKKELVDLITADFAYVRWLGDRQGIEQVTTTWDKTVVDRRDDLLHWVKLFRELISRNLTTYAYANNHYAGNGPATVKLFWELFEGGSQ